MRSSTRADDFAYRRQRCRIRPSEEDEAQRRTTAQRRMILPSFVSFFLQSMERERFCNRWSVFLAIAARPPRRPLLCSDSAGGSAGMFVRAYRTRGRRHWNLKAPPLHQRRRHTIRRAPSSLLDSQNGPGKDARGRDCADDSRSPTTKTNHRTQTGQAIAKRCGGIDTVATSRDKMSAARDSFAQLRDSLSPVTRVFTTRCATNDESTRARHR